MNQTADLVIVGGGVIGCFIAYELSKLGLEIVVVEKGQLGAEASSAAAGMLVPLHIIDEGCRPLYDLYVDSMRIYPDFVPELEDETGMRLEYLRSGLLRVSASEAEEAELLAQFQCWHQESGLELSWLDQVELHDLEPGLGPGIRGAILSHEEGSVNSARLVFALARAASNRNVRILQGCPVTAIRTSESQFLAVQTNQGEIAAGHVVIAAGAWSRSLCENFGVSIPISPARGQMLAVKTVSRLLKHPANTNKISVYPKADGSVSVGATVEHVGYDKRNTPDQIAAMLALASAMVPGLNEGHIERSWSGLRPFCQDGLPVLGKLPGWENIIIATGHFKMGITGSPITARLIRDLIVDERWEPALEIFSPARFLNQAVKEN